MNRYLQSLLWIITAQCLLIGFHLIPPTIPLIQIAGTVLFPLFPAFFLKNHSIPSVFYLITIPIASLSIWFALKNPIYNQHNHGLFLTYQPPENPSYLFYLEGNFPKQIQQKMVWYTIPYRKAPPKHYLKKIIAHWHHPSAILEISGPFPRTTNISLTAIKPCFLPDTFSIYKCTSLRSLILGPVLFSLGSYSVSSLHWFEVSSSDLSLEHSIQGVWIKAFDQWNSLDRILIIHTNGIHQILTFRNARNQNHFADMEKNFQEMIKTISINPDLSLKIASINQQLSQLNLKKAKPEELETAHQLLTSKLSLDPTDLMGFYHFGGTAFLLQGLHSNNKDLAKGILDASREYIKDLDPKSNLSLELDRLYGKL